MTEDKAIKVIEEFIRNNKNCLTGSEKTAFNMGVKSLNKYLNQYEGADEVSKDICKRLINLEEKLAVDIRCYL